MKMGIVSNIISLYLKKYREIKKEMWSVREGEEKGKDRK